MSNSMNPHRRLAVGAIGAGTIAGALLVGTAGPAQAVPEAVSQGPPAAVHVSDTLFEAPALNGSHVAIDRAPGIVFATDSRIAPMPQWWGHHWWRHHRLWHHWWWWW